MADLFQRKDSTATSQGVVTLNDMDVSCGTSLTVIVPTRNERETIGVLLERLGAAFAPLAAEILLVDDSDDDTPRRLAEVAPDCLVPVRLLHRERGSRAGGLSGAVVAGAHCARGDWILVLDADLQHPPEIAARLARTAMRHDADIVIGTRYAGAGSHEGLDGAARLVAAGSAMRLAKAAFPRRLATVSDPMSGLFAVRRDAVDLDRLNPVGFKILLELLVKHPGARVAEVAYEMAPRRAGESKASLREGLIFLRHLGRLRRHRLAGQLRERPATWRGRLHELGRLIAFGLVGLSGMVINTAALWVVYQGLGVHHLLGVSLATVASTTWNFILTDTLIYRRGRAGGRPGRAVRFFLVNILLLLPRLPAVEALIGSGLDVYTANLATLVALFLARFLISDRVIYGEGPAGGRDPVKVLVDLDMPETARTPSRKRYQYLPYRYDVGGIVSVGSQIVLPELEFFRAQWVADTDVDIAVRVGDVGRRVPRRRASMTEYADQHVIHYEEHLGRLGANFRIELGPTINIEVGPLLAASPHVVYTNIVEALLRFVMVSRDRMLLHSATVNLNGTGVMLSALTDTGKTATVLRLLRDHGGLFLSDDMTIVDAGGQAVCFPKPLTISAHTLQAVRANDLTPKEWRRLRFQSRLHSKGGRSLALRLARHNLPIMGINAITQRIVPPPKYSVDRLINCRIGSSVRVTELFIIERGTPGLAVLARSETLERMIRNTDDAYGFPPFRNLAPAITIDGLGYQQLREKERKILAGFLSNIRTRVIASDTFGWADEIPALLGGEPDGELGAEVGAELGAETETSRTATLGVTRRRRAEGWPHWAPSTPGGLG